MISWFRRQKEQQLIYNRVGRGGNSFGFVDMNSAAREISHGSDRSMGVEPDTAVNEK